MIYILWTLLNMGLFILFIIICFKATKVIRERIGFLAAALFTFGLLSFMSNATPTENNSPNTNNELKNWVFRSQNEIRHNTARTSLITVDKNFMSSITLLVQYGVDTVNNNDIPLNASAVVSGFSSGHEWKPDNIIIDTTSTPDKLAYFISGTMKWQLLGSTIYLQHKFYKGVFVTNH